MLTARDSACDGGSKGPMSPEDYAATIEQKMKAELTAQLEKNALLQAEVGDGRMYHIIPTVCVLRHTFDDATLCRLTCCVVDKLKGMAALSSLQQHYHQK